MLEIIFMLTKKNNKHLVALCIENLKYQNKNVDVIETKKKTNTYKTT